MNRIELSSWGALAGVSRDLSKVLTDIGIMQLSDGVEAQLKEVGMLDSLRFLAAKVGGAKTLVDHMMDVVERGPRGTEAESEGK